MNRVARAVAVALALAASAGAARAHRLGAGQVTAPVPLPMVFLGAGATVAATAAWLGWGGTTLDADTRTVLRVPPGATRAVEAVVRAGFLLLFVGAIAHGLLGRAVAAENLATLVLWPLVVKGVGLVAVVAGSPWRLLSPWRTLYDLVAAVEGRPVALLGSYPAWLGTWPAVAGFVLGVGLLENLTVVTRSPSATVGVAAGYTAIMLAGAAAFGREWFARADALAVLFDLLGRVSPLEWSRTDDGATELAVSAPWAATAATLRDTSLAVFVIAAVYTVSFDGFTATRTYQALLLNARATLGIGIAEVTLYGVGLVAFVASFLATAALAERAGSRGSKRAGDRNSGWRGGARAFGGTVVPIAAAYEVAHNYPFVAVNLGGAVTVSRELLLGTGGTITPLAWLPLSAFWASQVVLIVVGHLVAVVAAHRAATRRYGPADGRRGHAPLVVVMVGYTVLSLWIVSQPIVT